MPFISVAVVFGVVVLLGTGGCSGSKKSKSKAGSKEKDGALAPKAGDSALERELKKVMQAQGNPFYDFAKIYEKYRKGDIAETALEKGFNALVKGHTVAYSFAQFKNNQKALKEGGLDKKWYVLRHRDVLDHFYLIPAVTADLRYMNIVTLGLDDHVQQGPSRRLQANPGPGTPTPTRRTGIEVAEEMQKATTQVKEYSKKNPGDIKTKQNEDDFMHMWGGSAGEPWLHCRIGYGSPGISLKDALEVLKREAEGKVLGPSSSMTPQEKLEDYRKQWRKKAGIASPASP